MYERRLSVGFIVCWFSVKLHHKSWLDDRGAKEFLFGFEESPHSAEQGAG